MPQHLQQCVFSFLFEESLPAGKAPCQEQVTHSVVVVVVVVMLVVVVLLVVLGAGGGARPAPPTCVLGAGMPCHGNQMGHGLGV